jgi:hypothetical protein
MLSKARRRLIPSDVQCHLGPWRRATEHSRCALYWLPVSTWPPPAVETQWTLACLLRLAERLRKKYKLRPEIFLQAKTVHSDLSDAFLKNSFQFSPVLGLSRRPNANLPRLLTTVEELEPWQSGRKKFDLNDFMGDYCYWFLDKQYEAQLRLFLGYGGLTSIFLGGDPAEAAGIHETA